MSGSDLYNKVLTRAGRCPTSYRKVFTTGGKVSVRGCPRTVKYSHPAVSRKGCVRECPRTVKYSHPAVSRSLGKGVLSVSGSVRECPRTVKYSRPL